MAKMGARVPRNNKKSVFWAYVWWLFGGLLGLHHFYLGRDRQAFVMWSTLGGYFGMGWIGDVFAIPSYVKDVNEDPKFMEELIHDMKTKKKPSFSTNRFISMISVGYFWAQLFIFAIPEDEFAGINWKHLHWLTPLAAALGIWTVGNIGREKGTLLWPVLGAYASYPVRNYIYEETLWFSIMVLASALAFDTFSKEWRREPYKKSTLMRRILVIGVCSALYLSLFGCYLYFNGKITDSDGEEIPVHEAIHHFFTSPWWTDLKQSLYDIWKYAQHHGWYEVWKEIIDLSDPHGELNAYKVLDLSQSASQSQITAQWRKLSREFHPDKVKDPTKQRAAQEKFMEIQQAYEILSNIKNKRQRRNKKSVTD